jgi:Uma2 family endonuclease
MPATEIVLPVTEPETEWVCGRALQKVSPTRSHALVQFAIATALRDWARDRGEVAPEWRFRVTPPGEATRPLVPDVSYVAIERLRGLTGSDLEVPRFAPDVVVEVLSPGDRRADVDDKVATYLAAGSTLVIVIDPDAATVELHDADGSSVLGEEATLTHPALPAFSLPLAELFAVIAPPR